MRGLPRRTIDRGMNRPVTFPAGTLPDMSDGLQDYFQPLQMMNITKGSLGFEVIETGVVTEFRGVIMPFTPRQLLLKPEGERAWTWLNMWAERVLPLQVDDVMTLLLPDPLQVGKYTPKDTRVMAREDFSRFGFLKYALVQDWTGSRPLT